MKIFIAILAFGFTSFCYGEESDLEKANKAFKKHIESCPDISKLPRKSNKSAYDRNVSKDSEGISFGVSNPGLDYIEAYELNEHMPQ